MAVQQEKQNDLLEHLEIIHQQPLDLIVLDWLYFGVRIDERGRLDTRRPLSASYSLKDRSFQPLSEHFETLPMVYEEFNNVNNKKENIQALIQLKKAMTEFLEETEGRLASGDVEVEGALVGFHRYIMAEKDLKQYLDTLVSLFTPNIKSELTSEMEDYIASVLAGIPPLGSQYRLEDFNPRVIIEQFAKGKTPGFLDGRGRETFQRWLYHLVLEQPDLFRPLSDHGARQQFSELVGHLIDIDYKFNGEWGLIEENLIGVIGRKEWEEEVELHRTTVL